jgi:hypothetical protein
MIAVASAVIVAYALYQMLDVGRHVRYAWEYVVLAALGFGLVSVVLLDREGAYRKGGSLLRIRETERVLRVSVTTLALALAVSFFAGRFVSRGAVVLGVILVPLLLISEKQVVCAAVQSLHRRGYGIKKVLIYGAGFTGRRVLSALMRSPKVGLSPIAVLDDDGSIAGSVVYELSYRRANPVPVLAGPLTEEVLRRTGAEMLAVAIPSLGCERFTRALAACTAAGVQFAFVPGQAVGSEFLTDHTEIDGLLLSSFVQPTSKRLYDISKRLFDFLGAGFFWLPFHRCSSHWAFWYGLTRADRRCTGRSVWGVMERCSRCTSSVRCTCSFRAMRTLLKHRRTRALPAPDACSAAPVWMNFRNCSTS